MPVGAGVVALGFAVAVVVGDGVGVAVGVWVGVGTCVGAAGVGAGVGIGAAGLTRVSGRASSSTVGRPSVDRSSERPERLERSDRRMANELSSWAASTWAAAGVATPS